MAKVKTIVNIILFSLIVINMQAQDIDLEFEKITANNNLSSNFVTAVFQDKEGLMWFGTKNGLNSYDGYDIKVYRTSPAMKITSREITRIREDNKNHLWIISSTGLCIFNKKTKTFHEQIYVLKDSIWTKKIALDIDKDKNGKMWFSIRGSDTIYSFYDNIITQYKVNSRTTTGFNRVLCDDFGNVWLRSGTVTIYRFNPATNETFIFRAGYHRSIVVDNDGYLWIGGWGRGLEKLISGYNSNEEYKAFRFPRHPQADTAIPSGYIKCFEFDSINNCMWVGSPKGINKIDILDNKNNRFKISKFAENVFDPNALNSEVIEDLFVDRTGILWAGTQNGGVNKLDLKKKKFKLIGPPYFSQCTKYIVNSFYQVDDTSYLMGVRGNGIVSFNTNNFEIKPLFNDRAGVVNTHRFLNTPYINSAHSFRDYTIGSMPTIWIGTRQRGVYILEYDSMKNSTNYLGAVPMGGINNNAVNTICQVNDSIFLVGYEQGLSMINIRESSVSGSQMDMSNFIVTHGIAFNDILSGVNSAIKDSDGHTWIGTSTNGLIRITSFNDHDPPNSSYLHYNVYSGHGLLSNDITLVFEDSKKNLWIGTDGNGLFLYNKEDDRFSSLTKNDGWIAEGVYSVLEDDFGNIWFGTNKGLAQYRPDIENETSFKNFNHNDGLQANIFNLHCCMKTKKGDLFFGGNFGFNIVQPEKIAQNQVIPNIKINSINIYSRDLSKEAKATDIELLEEENGMPFIKLYHSDYAFSIDFSVLSYSNPDKNRYAYKLENFDNDWRQTGADKRFAYYSNLEAGEYIFNIKGSNSDGKWNETPARFKIMIIPPFWKTLWFRIMVILIIAGSGILFYYVRMGQIKKQKRILEEKVEERTKDLKEANEELNERQEEILSQNEEIQQQAEELLAQKESLEQQNEEIKVKNEQISKAYDTMQVLSDFGQKITSSLKVKAINAMLYDYISTLMDTAAFGVGLYIEKVNALEYPEFFESGDKIPYFKIPLEKENSMAVWCFKNEKDIHINNYLEEYQNYIPKKGDFKTTKIPMSAIYIPLHSEDKIIGIITVQSYKEKAYEANDLNILKTLASYVSIAMSNAKAYRLINAKNKHIESSIEYAKTIQNSILPAQKNMNKYFDSFVLFRPKDIVSGDFYWFMPVQENGKELIFAAVVDCTGHGVPGAFMSLIGNRLLNEIIGEKKIYNPAQILEFLNVGVQVSLRQDQTDNNDGMDVCFCCIEKNGNGETKVTYSGAKRSLYYYSQEKEKIQAIGGDRKSIGGIRSKRSKLFYTNKEITLKKGDIIYLSSDGFVDQNSPARKRFGSVRLTSLLNEIYSKSLEEQKTMLEKELESHMEDAEQRDDIAMLGFKLK